MKLRHFVCSLAFVLLVMPGLVGCGGAAPTPTPAASANPAVADQPYDEQANAAQDITAGLAAAQADNKYVFLDFGANWCPDCHALARIMEDPEVAPFVGANYHVVHVDVGKWDKNLDVSAKYGNPITKGIPAVVILDAGGKVVTATKAGELADARNATKAQIFSFLRQWALNK